VANSIIVAGAVLLLLTAIFIVPFVRWPSPRCPMKHDPSVA
jgi:hypothetical protein